MGRWEVDLLGILYGRAGVSCCVVPYLISILVWLRSGPLVLGVWRERDGEECVCVLCSVVLRWGHGMD